jgi:50S ribosomal protein L16 3-hydroxylase
MLYEGSSVFINGERFVASGTDARLLRALADQRRLEPDAVQRLTPQARSIALQWLADGWLEVDRP